MILDKGGVKMEKYKLGEKQKQLADLIWENEPLSSRTLVELCAEVFDWKRTTTYTMLKILCERGIFENRDATIHSLISREDFETKQGEEFLQESFGGSLPRFLAAFTRQNRLSQKDIDELQKLIDEHKEG